MLENIWIGLFETGQPIDCSYMMEGVGSESSKPIDKVTFGEQLSKRLKNCHKAFNNSAFEEIEFQGDCDTAGVYMSGFIKGCPNLKKVTMFNGHMRFEHNSIEYGLIQDCPELVSIRTNRYTLENCGTYKHLNILKIQNYVLYKVTLGCVLWI